MLRFRNTWHRSAGVPRASVVVVAGVDPAGCAGLAVDIQTLVSMRVHALVVPAVLTAQHPGRVAAIWPVPSGRVIEQLDVLLEDFSPGAMKLGLLGGPETARALARWLLLHRGLPVVLDPVGHASSGAPLASAATVAAIRTHLLPLVSVLTPNIPEAEQLLGRRLSGQPSLMRAASELRDRGPQAVLLKGGHALRGPARDYFADAHGVHAIEHPRLPQGARGTGCALASALAARIALGDALDVAARCASDHVHAALRAAFAVGRRGARVLAHPGDNAS